MCQLLLTNECKPNSSLSCSLNIPCIQQQLLLGKLYIELSPFCSENYHCLVYHIIYHHNQDEFSWKIFILQGTFTKSCLIKPIDLLHF